MSRQDRQNIVDALAVLCPGALWSISADDLSGLAWLDPVVQRPTDDQINAAIAALPQCPQTVTMLQARLALIQAGLIDKVNTAIAAASPATQAAWEYSPVMNRTDALVTTIGSQLNLTSATLDQLFTLAASLTI